MSDADRTVRVHLIGLPLDVHRRYGEHQEALRRELAFVEHARSPDAAPARLQALTEDLRERYGATTQAQNEQIDAALAAGDATIDLAFELPDDITDAVQRLGHLLAELDEFCREGELLTLVTPPDLLAYREWFLEEFLRQAQEGEAPRPWQAPEPPPSTVPTPAPDGHTAVRIAVDDDLDLATAPALRQELVEHLESGIATITLDLSACEFLDSTGLSLLVTTHRRLTEAGGGLRLAGVTKPVRAVLEMAGTDAFFGTG